MFLPPLYWFFACGDNLYAILRQVKGLSEVMKNIEANRKVSPSISFNIRCYHTITETYTDSDGNN